MKLGYGNKNKKKKASATKQKKRESDHVAADNEVRMEVEGEDVDVQQEAAAQPSGEDASVGMSSKERQKHRIALKKNLQVKVASLKAKRGKLTKLPGNRDARRTLSGQLKELVKVRQRTWQ